MGCGAAGLSMLPPVSAEGTTIEVSNSGRSICAIKTDISADLHAVVIKDIKFTSADSISTNKMHIAITLIKTQMALVENVIIVNYMTGIQVTYWVNQIRNCKTYGCGIGIQLSGKPVVKTGINVTWVSSN